MFRKSIFSSFFLAALVCLGYASVSAQNAPVTGRVELKSATGTSTPVEGALIEVYRLDMKAGFPSTKTNSKGEFGFAGLPMGGTYAFSVSAPGAGAVIYPSVKAGQESLLITMEPGDGKKLTEEQVRSSIAGSTNTGEMTAEQKKAQAEYEAKVKEVNEKNAKATKANEIIAASLKDGNAAFNAKDYDTAIAKYDEGIAADPEFVGSAPIFNNNRGAALTARAVQTYNKSVKLTDATEKGAGLTSVRKDIADAAAGYLSSWNILKNANPADIVNKENFDANKLTTLRGAKDTFIMAVRTEQVDPSVIESAKVLIPEYLSMESDSAKKAQANLAMADLYRVVGDSENAITAYKKILDLTPDDQDALAGAGLSLVNLGYINGDKNMLQEGANYLQKFADKAPDTHKYKNDAVALIASLKKEQNVTPQKLPSGKKKP